MFGSASENICACWKGLIRSFGDSMNTVMRCFPRIAYSAEPPVSPDVAPRILMEASSRASTYSNRLPRNCSAMSLNASVGPLDTRSRCSPGANVVSGVISSDPNTDAV